MRGLILFIATMMIMLPLAWGLRWLFEVDPDFGLGLFTGVAVAALLYWFMERTGIRETHY